MAVFKENISLEPLFVYTTDSPLSYGYENKDEVLQELRTRISGLSKFKKAEWLKVSRPLYGLQYIGYAGDFILKFSQALATEIYKEYDAVYLASGAILYIEEKDDQIYVFLVTGKSDVGLSNLRDII